MKQKLVFLLVISTLIFSCKKANDCEKCMINIIDDNGNIVSTYTKKQFIAIDPNGNWCNFVDNSGNTEFTDASGNYTGKEENHVIKT